MRIACDRVGLVALALLCFTLSGCKGKSDNFGPIVDSGSSVQITSLVPDPAVPLHVGQTVEFKVEASYVFTGETGTVALIVQAADGSGLAQPFDVVKKGSGKTSLETSVVVPETGALEVLIPLVNQGPNQLTALDRRTYKVVAK